MAIKIMIKAIVNHTSIVLNFSLSVGFRFEIADPTVIKIMEKNIRKI
jgi:hypothetical protein